MNEKDNSLFEEYEKLLKAYRSGDENAFSEIYEKSKRFVYATCYGILNNEEEAADAMQETYISVFSNLDTFDNDRMFIAWVKQIAAHKSLDMCKKRRDNISYDDVVATDESLVGDDNLEDLSDYYITEKVRRKELERIMREELSEVQYQTIHMYYYDELSVEKIAELMGCPEGTVKTRLKASRIRIKEGIRKYEKENKVAFAAVPAVPFLTRFFNVQSKDLNIPSVTSSVEKNTIKPEAKEVVKSVSGKAAKDTVKHGFLSTLAGKIITGLLALAVIILSIAVVSNIAKKKPVEPLEETEEETPEDRTEETEEALFETAELTPATETTADLMPSDEQIAAAYYGVVSDYEIRVLQCQEATDNPVPCINYVDITGDDIPECIVRYCSDSEDEAATDWLAGMGFPGPATMKVFILSYNPDDDTVNELFRRETHRDVAGWFSDTDLMLLDDGNLVAFETFGGRGYSIYTIEEYSLSQTGYELINTWIWSQETEVTVTHNDEPISEDEFNNARDDYENRVVAAVMPTYGSEDDGNFLLFNEFVALVGDEAVTDTSDISAVNLAYANILIQNEANLRIFDTEPDYGFPSCTYEDITGDGIPELMIQYAADSEVEWIEYSIPGSYTCASIRIYTYDPAIGEAVEMFYLPESTVNAGGSPTTDVALLDNGHLLIRHSDGEGGVYCTEYEVQENSLIQVNELSVHCDNYEFTTTFYNNGNVISEAEYDDFLSGYMNSIVLCLTYDVWFDPELYSYDDWEMTMYNHVSDNLYYYDDMMNVLAN